MGFSPQSPRLGGGLSTHKHVLPLPHTLCACQKPGTGTCNLDDVVHFMWKCFLYVFGRYMLQMNSITIYLGGLLQLALRCGYMFIIDSLIGQPVNVSNLYAWLCNRQ